MRPTNISINCSNNHYFRSLSHCSLFFFFFFARSLCSSILSKEKKLQQKKLLNKTKTLPYNIQHKKSQIKNLWKITKICTPTCYKAWNPNEKKKKSIKPENYTHTWKEKRMGNKQTQNHTHTKSIKERVLSHIDQALLGCAIYKPWASLISHDVFWDWVRPIGL